MINSATVKGWMRYWYWKMMHYLQSPVMKVW